MRNFLILIIAFVVVTVSLSTNEPPIQKEATATAASKATHVAIKAETVSSKPVVVEKPATPAPVAPPAPVASVVTPPATPTYPALSPNAAKAFIYQHESGNNPLSVNASSGACGLGQSLPCAKVLSACPTLDYNCEDAWFTQYANSRYGGWQGAYNWWVGHNWW